MPDFFLAPCARPEGNCQKEGVACTSTTSNKLFGLCDDPPPSDQPAYIRLYNPDEWIASVNNPNSKSITFKAIDNCVPVLRLNGELESRCDGMIIHDNNLVFVELKDRASKGWLSKGREQLTITIQNFIENHNKESYNITAGFVCNKQRPLAVMSISAEIQKFKDKTSELLDNEGILLIADRNILL